MNVPHSVKCGIFPGAIPHLFGAIPYFFDAIPHVFGAIPHFVTTLGFRV